VRGQRLNGRYSAEPMEVSGAVVEKAGRKWIVPAGMRGVKVDFPAKMLAPDTPLALPGKQPLVLKVDDALSLKCVLLPAGRYLQGAPYYQRWRASCEDPHEVVLTKPFWLAEIPVTQEMYEAVMKTNPCRNNPKYDIGPQCPVEQVPFADIQTFCRLLSEKNQRQVRLPTHGEWEYAARVGTSSPCFLEKYKDQRSSLGNGDGDGPRMHHIPVKSAQPNAWRLYDMLSCGEHMLSDWGGPNPHQKEIDPAGPTGKAIWNAGVHMALGYAGPAHLGGAEANGSGWEALAIFRVAVDATPEEIAALEKAAKK
jgi:hypothetical protein